MKTCMFQNNVGDDTEQTVITGHMAVVSGSLTESSSQLESKRKSW